MVSNVLQRLRYFISLWLRFGAMSLQVTFINRSMMLFFLLGKAVRFGMALVLLFSLRNSVARVGPYTSDQIIVFFVIYQLIDSYTQMIYRGVYDFGEKVRKGNLDFELTKPFPTLFRALLGSPDINDLLFAVPQTLVCFFILRSLNVTYSFDQIVLFGLLFINGFIFATAFHILVLAMAIVTTEIDNAVFLYRDLVKQAQLPVTLQRTGLRWLFFYVIPIGLMVTVPAEALMGLPTSVPLVLVFAASLSLLAVSVLAWKKALNAYASASS